MRAADKNSTRLYVAVTAPPRLVMATIEKSRTGAAARDSVLWLRVETPKRLYMRTR